MYGRNNFTRVMATVFVAIVLSMSLTAAPATLGPPLSDDFSSASSSTAWLWSSAMGGGPTVSETGGELVIDIPATATGDSSGFMSGGYGSSCQISSPSFAMQVDYNLTIWPPVVAGSGNGVRVGLGIAAGSSASSIHIETERVSLGSPTADYPTNTPGREYYLIDQSPTPPVVTAGFISTGALKGTLMAEMTPTSPTTGTYEGFYKDGTTGGLFVPISTYLGVPLSPWFFNLNVWSGTSYPFAMKEVKVAFDNFTVTSGAVTCPWSSFTVSGPGTIGSPITLGVAVPPGGFAYAYTWDFGDGSPLLSDGPTVSHTYAMKGTFTAKVTITTPFTVSITLSNNVTISSPGSVGGVVVPISKLALLAPYLSLAAMIALATVGTTIFLKRFRLERKKNES